jgi:hypothetical protein
MLLVVVGVVAEKKININRQSLLGICIDKDWLIEN